MYLEYPLCFMDINKTCKIKILFYLFIYLKYLQYFKPLTLSLDFLSKEGLKELPKLNN